MSDNILEFPSKNNVNVPYVSHKNRLEYLISCKNLLTKEDYRDVLCGIMDSEIYNDLELELKNIVNTYFDYKV